MVQDVVKVNTGLEMVAAAVWHDAGIEDVDLSDGPRVEPRFRKEFFQKVPFADLHIANPKAQALDASFRWDGAGIAVMEQPADGGNASIDASDFDRLEFGERIVNVVPDLEAVAMGTVDRSVYPSNRQMQVAEMDVRAEHRRDLGCERESGIE